jgi:hypothetical protein
MKGMNMKTKHKTSKILTESLKYLWDGYGYGYKKSRFVCLSVYRTGLDGCDKVMNMISKRLGRSEAVRSQGIEGWLFNQGIDTSKYHTKTIQNYRKRWVLNMIAEFEAKGD